MDGVGVIMIWARIYLLPLLDVNGNLPVWYVYFFLVRSTVLRKTRLVSSECVDGGNWYCSVSGSDWITFSCVDLRPFQGFWRWPSMVDCFLINFCAPKPMIVLANMWRIVFDNFYPSRLSGDTAGCVVIVHQYEFLNFIHRCSLQSICQESWTPSLVSLAGSNLTCTSLCLGLVYPSWGDFHSVCSGCGQTFHWRWIHIHDLTIPQWASGPYWALEKGVIFVLEAEGMGETGVLCVLKWWFPRLAFGWVADGQLVVYCCMTSQESGNGLSFLCLPLLGYPLVVQV